MLQGHTTIRWLLGWTKSCGVRSATPSRTQHMLLRIPPILIAILLNPPPCVVRATTSSHLREYISREPIWSGRNQCMRWSPRASFSRVAPVIGAEKGWLPIPGVPLRTIHTHGIQAWPGFAHGRGWRNGRSDSACPRYDGVCRDVCHGWGGWQENTFNSRISVRVTASPVEQRRTGVWVEVIARDQAGEIIYSSGVVGEETAWSMLRPMTLTSGDWVTALEGRWKPCSCFLGHASIRVNSCQLLARGCRATVLTGGPFIPHVHGTRGYTRSSDCSREDAFSGPRLC